MSKCYTFTVPCCYSYTITADSEEKAREILVRDGGIHIDGDLCGLDKEDYENAELFDVVEE